MKNVKHLVVAGAAAALFAAGAAHAQDIIKFGTILTTSGPAAHLGLTALHGAEVAIDTINSQGGIMLGGKRHTAKLVQYDDKCSAKDAVAVTERLLNEDKVPFIIGAVCSHATLAMMELTEKAKIPVVNAISASMKVTSQGYKYIFRTGPQSAMQAETVSRFVSEDLKLKKAAYIGRNDAWSQSASAQFKKRVEARGGSVVATEFYELGSTDFSSLLMKIKMANPEFLWIVSLSEDGALVVKQARELGIKAVLIGTDDMVNDQTFKVAGPAIEGMYSYYGGGPAKPEALAYEKVFEQKFKTKSMAIDKSGYDVVMLVADALKRAGSQDSEKITAALRATKQYKGIRTSYSFEDSGQAKSEMWMVKVEGMQPKFIKEIPIFTNPPLPVDRE